MEKNSNKKNTIKTREKELKELDRITKMLVRKDFELMKKREELEEKIKELKEKTKELEESKTALMNILEDADAERKKAEEERDKTLAIITNLADGLLVLDQNNKLSLINPQAENFFAIEAKNIIGKSVLELSAFQNLEPLISLIGEKPRGIFRKELSIKENLILEVSVIPIVKGEEGFDTLVILHDITREKLIEKMKAEFVSVAAHQLRTPLSAIKWTLKMILDGDLGEVSEQQKDFLEKAYQSNERMINLINDLLNVTRIEEGRFLYKPILTSIEDIVQSVLNSYKEMIERKNINLEFQKPEKELPKTKIDVEKISLAIQNLLDNAIKYNREGGKIIISLKHIGDKIEFSIKDNGVGIPKDQQERVFSKFFRGANALKMETEGSGLGLFIAKNIIEAHGGNLWFESEENVGTTFYFTIPIRNES